MKKLLLSISVLFLTNCIQGQNLLLNSDFEIMNACPTTQGEIIKATNWENVIASADYYNCGFSNPGTFPTNPVAYTGTGYIGFSSYGNSNGSSEAVGQNLLQPLLPNSSYILSFASKKTNGGVYSDNCGGVAIYGFKNNMPLALNNVHISQISGALLLGNSPVVFNTEWEMFSFNLTVPDTVNQIVFSVEYIPDCGQCVFLDSVSLTGEVTSMNVLNNDFVSIYPNPFYNTTTLKTKNNLINATLIINNIFGQTVRHINNISGQTIELQRENLASGIYFISLVQNNTIVETKKLVIKD
jgi:hypothetical protein